MSLNLSPCPVFTGLADNGSLLVAGRLYTYEAGTTTPLATYTDAAGLVPQANPIILDGSGRAVIYLLPRNYRFTLKTSAGVQVWDVDNINAGSAGTVDITGLAGNTLTAGQTVFLSEGNFAQTPGTWYIASTTNGAMTAPIIGLTVAAVTAGSIGSFRISGLMTGLTGLGAGMSYRISNVAGALAVVDPLSAVNRFIGQADSTTSLVIGGSPPFLARNVMPTNTGYVAAGGGQWAVDPADVVVHTWTLIGRAMWITLTLDTTSITGTVTSLRVPLPSGYFSACKQSNPVTIYDGTTSAMEQGEALTDLISTYTELRRPGLANFTASTHATYIRATWLIEVQ